MMVNSAWMAVFSASVFVFSFSANAVDAFHRKYSDIQLELAELAELHPMTAEVVSIGENDTGEAIQALKVGNGRVKNLVVATHHGNEYGSTEVALAFAHSIVESPIVNQTVYVLPVLNVSGYDARQRTELGFDPNRDYPGPCGSDGPFRLRSTLALAQFIERESIVSTVTLHTHSPIVLYPWGFASTDTSTKYDSLYIALSKAAVVESGYPIGNSADALYPANGCYEDYAMWKFGIWALLFEMGETHTPDEAQIREMIRGNVPGIRNFLTQAPKKRAKRHEFTASCDVDWSGPIRWDE